ncbi:MAG: TlpA disulfide reductase family protein [Gammaproteobacteria bacterium]|nr:TlpA disulfide reductase family protein [Gammaproteobacteria bacterium]
MPLPPRVPRRAFFFTLLGFSVAGGGWVYHIHKNKNQLKQQILGFWHLDRTTLDGQRLLLADDTKNYYLINYWASWCAPCREEIPVLNEYFNLNKQTVGVLGIALDQRAAVLNFLRNYPINYPVVMADSVDLIFLDSFGNITRALPFSLLLSREEIMYSKLGKLTPQDLSAWSIL